MKEVFDNATLYCGDCMDIMQTLEPVDAVVTDPPYGLREAAGKNTSRSNLAQATNYGQLDWDNQPMSTKQSDQLRAISTWQIIFGGNFFDLPPTSCYLVWDKQNTGDFADCELAWTNLPMAVRRVYWRWNGFIKKEPEKRYHPTQKPVGVMKWCIGWLKNTHTILDPFMGSGSTGVAALQLGKTFLGIEQHQPYFDIACRRIEHASKQGALSLDDHRKA